MWLGGKSLNKEATSTREPWINICDEVSIKKDIEIKSINERTDRAQRPKSKIFRRRGLLREEIRALTLSKETF